VNFFVVWRAKAQRRTEIGEDFSDLPKVGKLGTFFYLARKGAEAQRKNPFAASRLRESQFFFLKKTRSLHTVGRLCMNFFVVWRAKAQRRKEVGEDFSDLPEVGRLGTFVYLARKGAEAQRKTPLRLCKSTSFFSRTKKKSLR
jgi:hypothetical protein